MPEELADDLADAATRALRRHVGDAGRRRLLPRAVWVGVLEGVRRQVPVDDAHDAALRTDLIARAIAGLPATVSEASCCTWVTRSGDLAAADADLMWLGAAHTAFGWYGIRLAGFFVITRKGWHELLTEQSRTFDRVRPLPASLR